MIVHLYTTRHNSSKDETHLELERNQIKFIRMTQPAVRITPNGYEYGPAPKSDSSSNEPSEQDSPIAPFPNPKVPNYHEAIPAQPYPIGSLLPSDKFPQNAKPPKLFEELTIRGMTMPNRMMVSPMCQCEYSCSERRAGLWGLGVKRGAKLRKMSLQTCRFIRLW